MAAGRCILASMHSLLLQGLHVSRGVPGLCTYDRNDPIGHRLVITEARIVQYDHVNPDNYSLFIPTLSTAKMDYAYAALDKGIIPDVALRPVIRQLCRKRLREIDHGEYMQLHHPYPVKLGLTPRIPHGEPSSQNGIRPRPPLPTYCNCTRKSK